MFSVGRLLFGINANDELEYFSDLDDVRLAMACLEMIRSTSIEMNAEISRIEDTFNLLVAQNMEVPAETLRSVDTLR